MMTISYFQSLVEATLFPASLSGRGWFRDRPETSERQTRDELETNQAQTRDEPKIN